MGAAYDSRRYPGALTAAEVKDRFSDDQDQDRYENGHLYSGGIGMAKGLTVEPKRIFDSEQDAHDYLEENARKWGPALAVRAHTPDGEFWIIGAICAS